VPVDNELPPLEAEYHFILVPFADRLATVAPAQNVCDALPVGADGIAFTVANTDVLEAVVQPLAVAST